MALINATDIKSGKSIIIDGQSCIVRGIDKSKTGKHGASKVRIEAIGIIDGKKRIIVKPGHERLEVPLISKKRGQVLSISGGSASIMDLESYETIELPFTKELEEELKEGIQVEYWSIEGKNIIKRILGQ